MNFRKKILKDKAFELSVILFSFLSIIPLFLILFQIVKNGISVISIDFFTKLPPPPGEVKGGIINSLIGTLILVGIASLLSIPLGILIGIFTEEIENKFTEFLRIIVSVFQGLPSIVIGILAYLWVVKPMGKFSALSGGIGLALMMLPTVIKSTEETLKLIPVSLKEASYALGASYTRTIIKVVLPASFGGIISGVLIGVLRIAGETAPLLFTAFGNPFLNLDPLKPVDSLPLLIFNYAMSPYKEWHKIAWGASLVLIMFVLSINIFTNMAGERWKVKF